MCKLIAVLQPHKDRNDTASQEHTPKEKPTNLRPSKPVHPTGPKDPLAIRTIVISGLPASIDSKSLWKKVRKYEGAEKVEWPAKVNDSEDASTGVLLVFDLAYHRD